MAGAGTGRLLVALVLLVCGWVTVCCGVFPARAADRAVEGSPGDLPTGGPETALAGLTDEQVRAVLLERLQETAAAREGGVEDDRGPVAVVSGWLHLLDDESGGRDLGRTVRRLARHVRAIPDDLSWMVRRFAGDASPATAWANIGRLLLLFLAALVVELTVAALLRRAGSRPDRQPVPELHGPARFWAAVIAAVPALVRVVVFGSASLLGFLWLDISGLEPVRFLFMALFVTIVGVRIVAIFSRLLWAPDTPRLRLLPVTDPTAVEMHRSIMLVSSYILAGLAFLALQEVVGVQEETVLLSAMVLGTLLLLLLGGMVLASRGSVADVIRALPGGEGDNRWLREEVASFWHIPALLYLFAVWVLMIFQMLSDTGRSGAFLLSLLVVPLFFVLESLGRWVVGVTVATLGIYRPVPGEGGEVGEEEARAVKEKERLLVGRICRVVRVAILLALGLWVLSAWGYTIPYSLQITRAVFDILVTLAVALVFWRVVSSYIERKIMEATPEEEENAEQDDEWGAAATRGRSYTLLPMVRKFIGTVLVVMVTMTVLSAIGVDIGPLLAGAGVVGLAIGFGAQKLVSDVLSGFFYLLDDAFRVGEYLQAGSVSGSVEAITLRNVMLRHHRGMLQIVPYSELGSITNFMRGGIVVKFNLEFPYDTDIDKVRKIIKKVGKAMLEDPEFGQDFIQPVKSQGVREITNSVMVIRVKFTARPGTHFVIRREAYRRITEALAAQGIHYAHRKVIVELPREEGAEKSEGVSEEQRKKIAELGAAAGLAAMAGDEAKKEAGEGSGSGPAMPGM